MQKHTGDCVTIGLDAHQLPCLERYEVLALYPDLINKIQAMSVKEFMSFLQECKNKLKGDNSNIKIIEDLLVASPFGTS